MLGTSSYGPRPAADGLNRPHFYETLSAVKLLDVRDEQNFLFICAIAIAYSMGQIIKSVCVCQSVSVSVRLRALSRSHFLINFHQNWHRPKKNKKEERVR